MSAEEPTSAEERTSSPRSGGEGKPKTLQEMTGVEREEAKRKKAEGLPFLHQLVDEGQDNMTESQKAILERMKTAETYAGPKTRSFSLRPSVVNRSGSVDAAAPSADAAKSYGRFPSFDADLILGGGGVGNGIGVGNGGFESTSGFSLGSGVRLGAGQEGAFTHGGVDSLASGGAVFESGALGDGISLSAQQPDLLSSITQSVGGGEKNQL